MKHHFIGILNSDIEVRRVVRRETGTQRNRARNVRTEMGRERTSFHVISKRKFDSALYVLLF